MQKEACVLALGNSTLMKADEIRYSFRRQTSCGRESPTSMGVEGAADSHVRAIWGVFHLRRGAGPCGNECGSRIWKIYAGGYIQPFRERGRKEFRFPLGYANQRPLSAHWTVTGSGAFLVRAPEPDSDPETGYRSSAGTTLPPEDEHQYSSYLPCTHRGSYDRKDR